MSDNTEPQGRVNPTDQGPKNPSSKFIEWNSTEQCFSHYVKADKKDVLHKLPFTFIPLTRGVCIKGYNEPENTSYISNEVKNVDTDILTVKAYNNATKKNRVVFVGTWADIQKDVKAAGGAWTESIYIAIKGANGKLELANLQLNGSGIKHWFEFMKENDVWSTAVTVKEFTKEKKGAVNYTCPLFSAVKIKKETDIEAAVLQKEILAFLSEYYAKNAANTTPVSKPAVNDPKASTEASAATAFDNTKHPQAQHSEVINTGKDVTVGDPNAPEEF